MQDQQLEITLPATARTRRCARRVARAARARWWFSEMRRAVDTAPDPAPPVRARVRQPLLPLPPPTPKHRAA